MGQVSHHDVPRVRNWPSGVGSCAGFLGSRDRLRNQMDKRCVLHPNQP